VSGACHPPDVSESTGFHHILWQKDSNTILRSKMSYRHKVCFKSRKHE